MANTVGPVERVARPRRAAWLAVCAALLCTAALMLVPWLASLPQTRARQATYRRAVQIRQLAGSDSITGEQARVLVTGLGDSSVVVGQQAAYALATANADWPGPVREIVVRALADPDPAVHRWTVIAAARCRRMDAMGPALRLLESETTLDRHCGALALGLLGAAAAPCAQELGPCLRDRDLGVRGAACFALAQCRSARAEDRAQLRALLRDTANVVQWAAAGALASVGDDAGSERLRDAMAADDPWVRRDACMAAVTLGTADSSTLDALVARLGDPQQDVRRWAAAALTFLSPERARHEAIHAPLKEMLRSPVPCERAWGLAAACLLDNQSARQELERLTRHAEPVVRAEALAALEAVDGAPRRGVADAVTKSLGREDR